MGSPLYPLTAEPYPKARETPRLPRTYESGTRKGLK